MKVGNDGVAIIVDIDLKVAVISVGRPDKGILSTNWPRVLGKWESPTVNDG